MSSVSAGHAEAFRFEETVDTTVQTIKVDLSPGSTARTLVAGLYTSTRGQPEQLIASGSASVPANAGSVSVPVKPRYLAKDSGYWIAVLGVGGAVNTGTDQSSSCRSATTDAGSLTALPKSWGTGTRSNECASASVTYKPTTSAASTTSGLLTVPPVNTAAPTISGTAQEASTLTASTGSWTGSPTSYAYQWQDCSSLLCSNISGATGSSYTLRASDIGDTIDVVVTAANGGGSTSATSARTSTVTKEPVPVNTAAPTISGTAQQGDTLTTSNGTWSNNPTSYAYQWQDCSSSSCSNISGATSSSYTLQSSDVGDTIDVVVTATNEGGSGSATSAQTSAVKIPAPVNTAAPTISGTAEQGDKLTAANGTWSGTPTSYAYQWQDCSSSTSCSNISGTSSSSYTLQSSDVGKTIDVVVTATNAGGSTSATSAQTKTVTVPPPPPPVNTAAPTISGTAQQGDTLTASNGTWSNNPTSYAYKWQDCTSSSCTNISGATSSSYTLQSSDVGDTIDVVVTATNAGGSTSATSAQTATVTPSTSPAPVNTAAPTISGTAQQGDALTASNGTWSNNPTSYAYKWQDCTSSSSCTNISGATSSSYTLQSSDVGDTIDVVVTATNTGGSTSATSAQTASVTSSGSSGGGGAISPLHVSGNKLINANGQTVVLHGTDVSGTSYACEQNGGYGFSDTPTGNSLFGPMVSNDGGALPEKWTINSVTLLLNQDCWLGINGVPAQYSGQNYINFVKAQVASMESYGIYPTLVVGEGTDSGQPNYYNDDGQVSMPNNNYFPLLWEEIASEFKNDPNVIFRLFEEPFPDGVSTSLTAWKCWSQGDDQYSPSSDSSLPAGWESSPGTQIAPTPTSATSHCNETDGNGNHYATVGMQSLLNIIRGAGANNIIQIPGVAYANMLSCSSTESPTQCGFLDSADGVKVDDTLNPAQLMADTDNYPDSGQDCEMSCVTATYGPVAAVMPIDMGEVGTDTSSGTYTDAEQFIQWYDSEGQSYYGSQWETWSNFISNYDGTPGENWGTWYYDHITGANCSTSSGC